MFVNIFSGPCITCDIEPTRNDSLGPGIRLANNLLLPLFDLSTIIIIKKTDNRIYIQSHMNDSFKSITYTHDVI